MKIVDLDLADERMTRQLADLLVIGFKDDWPDAWPTVESALQEVQASVGPGRLSRVALDEDDNAIGWIGGISQYSGHVWEVHPLVVRPDRQGQGIGRALVLDLERLVAERGGLTLWVGTDDEADQTSLGGVDLYPNPLEHLANIRSLKRHPYRFYQKLGFALAGVLPDANGPGKPDIFLAKRVGRPVG